MKGVFNTFIRSIRDPSFLLQILILIFGVAAVLFFALMMIFRPGTIDPYSLLVATSVVIGTAAFSSLLDRTLHGLFLDRPEATKYLDTVRYELKMMGISLYNLHSDDTIPEIIKTKFMSRSSRSKLKLGARSDFRFLLISPASEFIECRTRDENKNANITRLECIKTIKRLEEINDNISKEGDGMGNKFEYRIYDHMPTHSMIITDEWLLVGPYLFGMRGYSSKWVRVTTFTALNQYYIEFEKIWNTATPKEQKDFADIIDFAKEVPVGDLDKLLANEDITVDDYNSLVKRYNGPDILFVKERET